MHYPALETHLTANTILTAACCSPILNFDADPSKDVLPEYPSAYFSEHFTEPEDQDAYFGFNLDDVTNQKFEHITTAVAKEKGVQILMGALLRVKDYQTWNHCKRVGLLAAATALRLEYSDSEVTIGCRGGMLHDIGKANGAVQNAINTPKRIEKDVNLFNTIKRHPWHGVALALKASPHLISPNEIQLIGNHHALRDREPYGVFEQDHFVEIPDDAGHRPRLKKLLEIIHCCDTLDAITASHPGRAYQADGAEPYHNIDWTKQVIADLHVSDEVKEAVLKVSF